jgi:CRISPR-associated protein (TIGR03984 family)
MARILNRTIAQRSVTTETFASELIAQDPISWLKGKATDEMILLAHADDGVIWGRFRNHTFYPPQTLDFVQAELRPVTLQMARLFSQETEIFLWRVNEGMWRARQVTDGDVVVEGSSSNRSCFDEEQVLWGTGIIGFDGEFSLSEDGEEGFHHAPPVHVAEGLFGEHQRRRGERKLRLMVRHYLEEDKATGWLRIGMSRLTDVGMEGKK